MLVVKEKQSEDYSKNFLGEARMIKLVSDSFNKTILV